MNEAATEPPHKRRWYQYSLRSLLIVITVLGIWLGYISNEARKQKAVVEWVEEKGGKVGYYNYPSPYYIDGEFFPDTPPPAPNRLRDWIGIDYFYDVKTVAFSRVGLIDLSPLEDLTNLEHLILWDCQVTKQEVQKLEKALPNCEIDWNGE